jgi:hypothetical protein
LACAQWRRPLPTGHDKNNTNSNHAIERHQALHQAGGKDTRYTQLGFLCFFALGLAESSALGEGAEYNKFGNLNVCFSRLSCLFVSFTD